jgi:hypothetical protein
MNNQEAVSALRGVRDNLRRRLSQPGSMALANGLLTQAIQQFGNPKLMANFGAYAGLVMSKPTFNVTKNDPWLGPPAKKPRVRKNSGERAYGRYRNKLNDSKKAVRQSLGEFKENSPEYHLYNAVCGLEPVFQGNYKMGIALVFDHLASLNGNDLGFLADQIAALNHFVTQEDKQATLASLLENLNMHQPAEPMPA